MGKKRATTSSSDVSSTGDKLRVLTFAIPTLIACFAICYYVVPSYIQVGKQDSSSLERILFGMRCCAFSSIPMLLGIQVVANQRLYSSQINPLAGSKPSYRFEVNSRFLSNTTEQFLLLIVGTMAACATGSIDLRFILSMNILYFVGRFVFWIGYHIAPTRRAAGVSLTFFATYSLCLYSSFVFITEELPNFFII